MRSLWMVALLTIIFAGACVGIRGASHDDSPAASKARAAEHPALPGVWWLPVPS